MKRQIQTTFAQETRFDLPTVAAVPFRGTTQTELEQLKDKLLKEALRLVDAELNPALRRAANEAVALAGIEPFPLLVLPALFEEKARVARQYVAKQRAVRLRTRTILAEAA